MGHSRIIGKTKTMESVVVCMYMHDVNVYSYYTLRQIDIIE